MTGRRRRRERAAVAAWFEELEKASLEERRAMLAQRKADEEAEWLAHMSGQSPPEHVPSERDREAAAEWLRRVRGPDLDGDGM